MDKYVSVEFSLKEYEVKGGVVVGEMLVMQVSGKLTTTRADIIMDELGQQTSNMEKCEV